MKAILIGFGEIGKAVYEVFSPYHEIDVFDSKFGGFPLGEYNIMLVAIPYSDKFVDAVEGYRLSCNPKATIIFSTVAIGTTRQIPNAVHSPVEGKHPKLAESMRKMRRWVGGSNEIAELFMHQSKIDHWHCDKPEDTELLKLQSTAMYGLNIEFARYVGEVCKSLGTDYELVKRFNADYNRLYENIDLPQFQRYILDPPKGNIGGHCIVSNSKILDSQFPNLFLKEIYRDKEGQHD